MTDEQLLERFVAHKDAAAFEELVRRHGPMVLRVCRRVLQQAQDAEDAFQVTFLVLARKAAAIAKRGSVGSWLHGVAYRVALQTRDAARKQPAPVGGAAVVADRPQEGNQTAGDARQALDEELNRLPEKYRAPLVLCYLEGKTNDEAADQLGCSRGTIATRLSRGRDRLRDGLVRRGVTVSGAVVVAALTQSAAKGALPATLTATTVKAATAIAAGKVVAGALLTAQAAALFHVTLRGMFWAKMKLAALVVTAAAVVTVPTAYIALKPDTSGLVGHYTLTESKGTQVRDESANGNHGKLIGGVTWVAGPKPGTQALEFDGKTGHVQLSRDASPLLGNTTTLACWIKTTQTGGANDSISPAIVGTAVAEDNDVVWGWLDSSGRIGVAAGAGPEAHGPQPSAQSQKSINDGRWHHVAMTRNAGTGEVAIYVDGVFHNKTSSGVGPKPAPLTALGRFDCFQQRSVYYFRGALGDVRIYSRLLSADEIRRLAQ